LSREAFQASFSEVVEAEAIWSWVGAVGATRSLALRAAAPDTPANARSMTRGRLRRIRLATCISAVDRPYG
jgi:hypothetical protein